MKAILPIIICLLLASSVLFVPSVLARELKAVELQTDDPYRRTIGSPRTGKKPLVSSCRRGTKKPCLPGHQKPPPRSRSCGSYKRNCPPPN